MQKINPFLWFNDNAEQAARFYVSIFKNSRIVGLSRYGEGAPLPAGSVMSITFKLEGQLFMALNGGPHFAFTPAISFFVNCETQWEVDQYYRKLSSGGKQGQCGWLTDQFGLSWQIVPTVLGKMLQDKNAQRSNRVLTAMLQMTKLDIKILKQAYGKR